MHKGRRDQVHGPSTLSRVTDRNRALWAHSPEWRLPLHTTQNATPCLLEMLCFWKDLVKSGSFEFLNLAKVYIFQIIIWEAILRKRCSPQNIKNWGGNRRNITQWEFSAHQAGRENWARAESGAGVPGGRKTENSPRFVFLFVTHWPNLFSPRFLRTGGFVQFLKKSVVLRTFHKTPSPRCACIAAVRVSKCFSQLRNSLLRKTGW